MAIQIGDAELRRQTRVCTRSAELSADNLARDIEWYEERQRKAGNGLLEQRLSEALAHLRQARSILGEIADECTEGNDQ